MTRYKTFVVFAAEEGPVAASGDFGKASERLVEEFAKENELTPKDKAKVQVDLRDGDWVIVLAGVPQRDWYMTAVELI